jgi:RluA family pseudouridine synthase
VEAPADGARLDDFLAGWLPAELERPLSRSSVRRLVLSGSVSVDGRVSRRPAFELRAGSRVEAAVDLSRLPEGRQASAGRDAPRVLFEDDWLLAVDKPSGVPFHAGADAGRPDFVGYVRAWLASRTPSAEPPYLGVHQRLDRDTSGVVVFARAPQANAGLAEQFERRQVEKTYLAVVARPPRLPPRAWSADAPLGRVGRGRQGPVAPDQGGRDARTELRLLDVGPRALLVEARPLTGRQHQIRVHLALAGLPILGDRVYGPGGAAARLLLHAARLALRHPRDGRALVIECPPPPEFAAALAAAGPARTRRG